MTQVFKNNAFASLAAELSAAGTLATLAAGQGARFPAPSGGDHFLATLILLDGNGAETAWEVVKCTARATDGLTIERAQEGTTARIWPAGSRIEMRVTAGTLDSFTDTAQAAAAAPVQSVFGRTGAIVLQSADVTGALGFTPLDAAQKSAANGIAPLGADSKVPASYLPSYVNDVYASKTISANTTLNADSEYETGRNLRINHGVTLAVPSTTLLIVRKYAAGSSL